MKKYYKIPLTERIVKVDDIALFDILQEHHPDLYNREKGRVELQYGIPEPGIMTPQLEADVKAYNQETARIYCEQGVPMHIIAIQKDDEVKEYATGTVLQTFGFGSILQGREVSQQEAYEYLDKTPYYIEAVGKIFAKEDKKSLVKSRFQKVSDYLFGKKDN